MRKLLTIFALTAAAWSQETVAPTPEPTSNPRGDTWMNYNLLQSFELGYRWHSVGGDADMYRSAVNFGNGIRLLSGSLYMKSREGHGRYFDELTLSTQGLGNDPYQSATARLEKNGIYRYDLLWRSVDYFNSALTIANGEHRMDTTRRLQDHDFTLFPQGKAKLFLGYSSNTSNGPALTTIQLFNQLGDEFPVFQDIRQKENEYRLGGEITMLGFRLNAVHGWEDFKDDTPVRLPAPTEGNNPDDFAALSLFNVSPAYHGASPYWRVGLFREGKRRWAMTGRFTYVAGRRAFRYNEYSGGVNFNGSLTSLQVFSSGAGERPTATGNLTFSLFPASFLTITNQSSFYNIRMVGTSVFVQAQNGVLGNTVVPFQFLGIETAVNSTDAELHLGRSAALHGGYSYAYRRVASTEDQVKFGGTFNSPDIQFIQSNRVHTGTLGFRLKPLKPVTISVDGEIGRADRPIYPISDRNYQAFRGRLEYKRKSFRAEAYAKTDYNTNSVSLTSFASRSRQYGFTGTWTANSWFSIDAGYTKLHLYTLGGIDYFVGIKDVSGQSSLYVSNIHSANLGARVNFLKRADVFVGYSHVQDVGDGRATPFGATTSVLPQLLVAPTFPVRFLSPQLRLSVQIRRQIRWNAGYQHYAYEEHFGGLQDFRAQTGYSSISWSF